VIRKKPVAVPTIEERLAAVAATKGAALSVFEVAVRDLNEAKDAAREIEAITFAEIERLQEVARAAADEAIDAEIKASNIETFALGK
jgi:hypothetical protein